MSVAQQIVSPLCLFTQRALPLDSSHSALNVHNASGNCCFPLPLKSHRFTGLSPSVLLFIFKSLNQDKYPQVNHNRRAVLCAPQKCPENLLSWHTVNLFQLHEEAGRMWVCVCVCVCEWEREREKERERERERERGSSGGGTSSGLAQTGAYSRDCSASVSSSPLQRLGGEVLWNHTITVNLTTLSKHNRTEVDRWERDRRKGWSFTADTREDKNI